jgi:hypothetical protein
MLLGDFSNDHMRMMGPLGVLASSDRRLGPMDLVFCLYGAAPHPVASGRMMVKRVGIFLLPLYVSLSNETAEWLMARNLGFFCSSSEALKMGRDLRRKSCMVC